MVEHQEDVKFELEGDRLPTFLKGSTRGDFFLTTSKVVIVLCLLVMIHGFWFHLLQDTVNSSVLQPSLYHFKLFATHLALGVIQKSTCDRLAAFGH